MDDDVRKTIDKYQPNVIIVHAGGVTAVDDRGNRVKLLADGSDAIEIANSP